MGAAIGAVLRWVLGNWKLAAGIGVLLALAGTVWYVQHLRASNAALHTRVATAQFRARANARAAQALDAEMQRRAQIRAQLQQWQQATEQQYGRLRDDIRQQLQTSSEALRACLHVRVDDALLERLRRGATDPDAAHPAAE